MGQKLVSYYVQAASIGGAKAKIEFIKLVGLATSQAESIPDSPELVKKFEDAFGKVKEQFN